MKDAYFSVTSKIYISLLIIYQVSIARKALSISMFRPRLCTKSVYKINESPNIYLEKTEYGPNSVLRQSLVRKRCWQGKHAKKLENLDFRSSYILKRNNSLPSLRESNENSRIVPGISFERPSFSDRNPFTNRKSICFSATGFSETGYSANYVI